ncbi:MAG: sialidase family protein [Syntrophotaleaceae bacterium]
MKTQAKITVLLLFLLLLVPLLSCGGGGGSGSGDTPSPDPPPIVISSDWEHEPTYIETAMDAGNTHYNSGGRRLVRIDNTTLALVVDGANDHLYRTQDNGASWTEIDSEAGFSGCLLTGPGSYVYHFSRFGTSVRMVKFIYNATTIPAPINIFTNMGLSNHGAYTMLNGTVDADGNLYVFIHFDTGTGGDTIFLLKSEDHGSTWNPPVTVRTGNGNHSYGYMHSDVTPEGDIVLAYSEWGSLSSQFAISSDGGDTWSHTEIASGSIYNPCILPVGNNEIYVFAQSDPNNGLVFKKSSDSGATWPATWTSIQSNHTGGYADPSAALGSDGTIYVAFRGAETLTALSDDLREFMARSVDGGASWDFPDKHLAGGRVGTRSNLRYQTWYNYGGPLEWTWLEENGLNTNIYPTMYDINSGVNIFDITNL